MFIVSRARLHAKGNPRLFRRGAPAGPAPARMTALFMAHGTATARLLTV